MDILIACEESATVRQAASALGHNAWSCDLLPSRVPGNHIQDDVLNHLDDGWDLMIAHPPCTYLSRAGCHLLKEPGRLYWMAEAASFFNALRFSKIPRIAIENPIPHRRARDLIGKYDQIVYPYQFGDPYHKPICLWLKSLPKLKPSTIVVPTKTVIGGTPGEERQRMRSTFYPGLAHTMIQMWAST
jgi:hypothetical protein